MKILVLDGNSSQCLPLIYNLTKHCHDVYLVTTGRFTSGYFSIYPKKRYLWVNISRNYNQYYDTLISHLKNNSYDLVLGLSDITTNMLSENKLEIQKYTNLVVPDYDVYQIAADKCKTMFFCMNNNVPCPRTFDLDTTQLDLIFEEIEWPMVAKPKIGVGAVGFTILKDAEEARIQLPIIQKEVGPLLIQEYIPNNIQYTAEVFCDGESEMKACVIALKTRFFPSIGGTSTCNVTVNDSNIESILARLLKKMKWTGSANIDLILDPLDNVPKVIEINPRVGATVKLAFLSGIDIADMTLKLATGEIINKIDSNKEGIVMRNLLLDIMWWITVDNKARKKTNPSFYKFAGKLVSYQTLSIKDPFTGIGFLLNYIITYSNIKKLKKKLGIYDS